jgi:hypothetical protein
LMLPCLARLLRARETAVRDAEAIARPVTAICTVSGAIGGFVGMALSLTVLGMGLPVVTAGSTLGLLAGALSMWLYSRATVRRCPP